MIMKHVLLSQVYSKVVFPVLLQFILDVTEPHTDTS